MASMDAVSTFRTILASALGVVWLRTINEISADTLSETRLPSTSSDDATWID